MQDLHGVPFRNIREIPRFCAKQKVTILGESSISPLENERESVRKEVAERSHPLFWSEWKPISLYSRWMADCHATEVVDMTPGSGAAAVGAIYQGIPYLGICESEAHKDWLQSHLLLTFMALAVDKKVPDAQIDAKVLSNVTLYLSRAVGAVRIYIAAAKPSVYGESYTGADDSENDE